MCGFLLRMKQTNEPCECRNACHSKRNVKKYNECKAVMLKVMQLTHINEFMCVVRMNAKRRHVAKAANVSAVNNDNECHRPNKGDW